MEHTKKARPGTSGTDGNPDGAPDEQRTQANYYPLRSRVKQTIEDAALHGFLPWSLAAFLVQRGGLRHD